MGQNSKSVTVVAATLARLGLVIQEVAVYKQPSPSC
jgi:hypothetical protein